MSKHDDIHETPDVSYIHNEGTFHEHSDVNVSGIAKFTLGLFILTVVTFGLMYAMKLGFEWNARQTAPPDNPMMVKDKSGNKDMSAALPPEPRLQVAPGFRYVRRDGKVVDLSLSIPQSEWREYEKEYKEILEKGLKDEKGNYIIKPLHEVEDAVVKSLPVRQQATEEMMEEAKKMPSSSSSGRMMEMRRQ